MTKGTAWLLALALLAAQPALAVSYSDYANATAENQLAAIRVVNNLVNLVDAGPYRIENARSIAYLQINNTVTTRFSRDVQQAILDAAGPAERQDVSEALRWWGYNASQIVCTVVIGGNIAGNCPVYAGLQGSSGVARNRSLYIRNVRAGDFSDQLTLLLREAGTLWVDIQKQSGRALLSTGF